MTNTAETPNACGLKREDFQTTINKKKTDLFILRNAQGNEVAITNYGGAIVAIMVPDKNGNRANVIMGHDNIEDVINSPEPYLSRIIGRYGNRIAKGKFTLRGKGYCVPVNNGPNSLHGGKKGFNDRVWDAELMNENTLVLHYISAYGEEGYTGELKITVEYTWTDNNDLQIFYLACTNKQTILNLTHHGFFALAGINNPTPTIDNVDLELNANYYLPIDETSIPTGEIRMVEGTPFDFRTAKPIGRDIEAEDIQIKNGSGYDHCFVLNKKEEGELSLAAKVHEPLSGRTMDVYTTEPGVQLYTGNFLNGIKGNHGATYPRRSAICLECQHFPDTPNHPYFPSVTLSPGEQYKQTTIYHFGVSK